MRWDRRWVALVVFAGFVPVLGCGPGEPKFISVTGKVNYDDGTPLKSGQVTLSPGQGNDYKGGVPSGQIKDGTYKIVTNGKDGAPAGQYNVAVQTVTPTGGGLAMDPNKAVASGTPLSPTGSSSMGDAPPINAKFTAPDTSGLHYEVKDGQPAGAYDLKVTK